MSYGNWYSNSLGVERSGDRSLWGAKFNAPVHTDPGAHPASYTMCTDSILGIKRPGRGVTTHHQLAPRLKKEYGYASTPPLVLRGLF
jgi:hypothetical protein